MTIASTMHSDCARQPAGIDRLAQRLGLALVAWGERSKRRPEVTREDLLHRRAAAQLLADRERTTAARSMRSF